MYSDAFQNRANLLSISNCIQLVPKRQDSVRLIRGECGYEIHQQNLLDFISFEVHTGVLHFTVAPRSRAQLELRIFALDLENVCDFRPP